MLSLRALGTLQSRRTAGALRAAAAAARPRSVAAEALSAPAVARASRPLSSTAADKRSWIEERYVAANVANLKKHFGGVRELAGREDELCARIEEEYTALMSTHRSGPFAKDERSHHAKEVLRKPFGDEGQFIAKSFVKFRLWLARDAMESAISIARTMEIDWGKGFEVEHAATRSPEGRAERHETIVRRCFFDEFLRASGAEELLPMFCRFDAVYFEALEPARHGVAFDRPETIAEGHGRCLFRLARTK